jgi:hypothetical protein
MKGFLMQVYDLSSGPMQTALLVLAQLIVAGWGGVLLIRSLRHADVKWAGIQIAMIVAVTRRWITSQLEMPPPPPVIDRAFRYFMAGFSFVAAGLVFIYYVAVVMAWIPVADHISFQMTAEILTYVVLAPIAARWIVAQGRRELRQCATEA